MGPGKDTHGTLGPFRRKAVGGPINAPQGEVTHNDGVLERDNRQVFRQTTCEFVFLAVLSSAATFFCLFLISASSRDPKKET